MNSSTLNSSVLLQAFNWNSWRTHNKDYFKHLASKSNEIQKSGIDAIWLPPCSKSVSPQGYMPLNLYDVNSEYGSESDLRDCVKTFKQHNIDVYADIVVNHRCAEFQNKDGIYNVFGGKLSWNDTAIVSNDTTFRGKGNHSDHKLFEGAPNIDHSQSFVKNDLIEWMLWLRNDIGFDGFRFDFMTGINPQHMKEYFVNIDTEVCIGEYWDSMNYDNGILAYDQNSHRQRITDWIDQSGQHFLAFDMTTKGILQEALKNKEYWRLSDHNNQPPGLIGWWKQRSVTFLDNHDTHYNSQNLWPFPYEHIIDGYVYILTHPGIPMVFWDDLCSDHLRGIISGLIELRKKYNINGNSTVQITCANDHRYSAVIDERIAVTIGLSHQIKIKQNIIFESDNTTIEVIH